LTANNEASRFGRFWPVLLIMVAGLAVYARSLSGPFLFDDAGSIVDNSTIRHLWPITTVLSPPSGGRTVSGRPIVNLTFALNYAFGGTNVRGYHLVNLVIHLLAGVTLFGIARRTLRPQVLLAFVIALIWTVHPLQTEAVTYIVQRAESLMGLFYLLTIYCFIRYADATSSAVAAAGEPANREAGRRGWAILSVLACLLGMATKEDMVSAPLVVLLYDRTFLAGGFGKAWRRRRPLYLGLAATWILLGYLVAGGGGNRGGSMGFAPTGPWWAYGLTQFQAIAHYLRLTIWPEPLVFEYGVFWVTEAGKVVPYACVVGSLLAATIVALWRWPAWGFLGCWFFAALAPTSLVSTATQMIVEHRMYLALAPALAAIVCGGHAALGKIFSGNRGLKGDSTADLVRWGPSRRLAASIWVAALIIFAGTCGALTIARNRDYRSAEAMWTDTVAKRPENALAHNNLGTILDKMPGRLTDAIGQYEEALRLKPDYVEAHRNLGNAELKLPGRRSDAVAQYEAALRLNPDYAEAHNDLGTALEPLPGRLTDAIAQYEEARRLKPDYVEPHINLGSVWLKSPGRLTDAIAEFEAALQLNPDDAEAHNDLGSAWLELPGRSTDAIAQYQEALRLNPDYAEAHNNLGNAWLKVPGRSNDAIAQFVEALRLNPDYAEAHYNLGNSWAQLPGRMEDAIAQYEAAVRLKPDYAAAHNNLGNSLNAVGRIPEAIVQYEAALRIQPEMAAIHFNLALALLRTSSRTNDAAPHLETVLRLQPENDAARRILTQIKGPPP
jgi:protein O-mannosyl-transferase